VCIFHCWLKVSLGWACLLIICWFFPYLIFPYFCYIHHSLSSTFTTVYSMRPLPTGAVFRCFPGWVDNYCHFHSFMIQKNKLRHMFLYLCYRQWKVFYDDPNRPNRYLLARELTSRPDATDIEVRHRYWQIPYLLFFLFIFDDYLFSEFLQSWKHDVSEKQNNFFASAAACLNAIYSWLEVLVVLNWIFALLKKWVKSCVCYKN
jgi:hypothetical protein